MKPAKGMELHDNQYFLDGQPFFMFSGELHYFRVPAKEWPDRLKKAKAMGLNTVSSYIPWIWHEPTEGQFDLTGQTHPQRNLVKFLELCAEHKLRFLGRPGPVTHGEIKNGGLPQWLLDLEGGIYVTRPDQRPCDCLWLPSFFLPLYQSKVRAWYGAVLPVLEKFQSAHGGPLVQLQLDNEIHMQNWLGKQPDYRPSTTKRYQDFLRGRYQGDLRALNGKYGTAFADWSQVAQPVGQPEQEGWPRLWEWSLYYRDHYAGYFEFLAGLVRRHGLQVPVSANVAQFVDFNMCGRGWESIANTNVFRDFAVKVPGAIFGGAFQMRHLDFENFHDIIYTIESLRSITAPGIPSNCAELQVGVINDRPRIYPSDVELNLKTTAAHGLQGINGYMTFGGVSPDEIQMRGNYHEWQAPVAANGDLRVHAEPLRRFGRFAQGFNRAFSRTQTVHDLTLAYDGHYYFTEFIQGPFFGRMQGERNYQFFDGSARLLGFLGYTPNLLDLERATAAELAARPALWLFTLDFLSRPVMEKLVAYVRQGGKLVLNPGVPVKNSSMQDDTTLLDALGLKIKAVRPGWKGNYFRQDGLLCGVESDMTLFDESGVTVLARDQENQACAVHKTVGKGAVAVVGFGLYHQYDYLVALTRKVADALGLKPSLQKSAWDVHAALRFEGRSGWVYVANFHDAPKTFSVKYTLPGAKAATRFPSQGELALPRRSAYFFPAELAVAEDVVIREATVEVLQADWKPKTRSLEIAFLGLEGQAGVIRLAGAKKVRAAKLGGKSLKVKTVKGVSAVELPAGEGVRELSVRF